MLSAAAATMTTPIATSSPAPWLNPPQTGLRYWANEIDASAITITYSMRIAQPAMKLTSSLKACRASIEEPPRSGNIAPPST